MFSFRYINYLATGLASSLPSSTMVAGYIKAYPGMMSRLADMLFCCSEAYIFRPDQSPEALSREVLERSLRFFQHGGLPG